MHYEVYQKSLSQDPQITNLPHISKVVQERFKADPSTVLVLAQRFPVPQGHSIDENGKIY